jgi:hypothetical protein
MHGGTFDTKLSRKNRGCGSFELVKNFNIFYFLVEYQKIVVS